jgi:hypothetical protein
MTRSSAPEHAERINAALELLKENNSPAKAAAEVAVRFGISRSQAYRYVRKAGAMSEQMVVPSHKIAFTIKLSQDLVQTLREYTASTGRTLSEVVTQALENFLRGIHGRG